MEGLVATESPGDIEIAQGGISRAIKPISPLMPDWIQAAHIGPPVLADRWEQFDGSAHVDILYRGVFVASVAVDHLWAIDGAIHVDSKRFRPKLNREGFVGDELQSELEPFLRSCHPAVLERALECVREVLSEKVADSWTLRRWATLWLAVPRRGPYAQVAQLWDEEFRSRKAFRLLGPGDQSKEVSIRDLEELAREQIYVAPLDLSRVNEVTQLAVRVLRNSGDAVVQGVNREKTFLRDTNFVGASTGDILIGHFRGSLPQLTQVEAVANDVIGRDAVTTLFDDEPFVNLVRLGVESAAVLPIGQEIWINIDSEEGRDVVRTVCGRNEGHIGLWIACMRHGRRHARQIASVLRRAPSEMTKMGPIRRQYLMGLVG